MPEGYKIGEGYPAPTLEELKEFTRWFIESTKGRLADDGRPTKNTIKAHAQEFVPGFFLETGNEISSQDATELYYRDGHTSGIATPRILTTVENLTHFNHQSCLQKRVKIQEI
ncbi:hypothetical protein BDV27DRAFT_164672 [Aspergillus caelatus]|uniref:Uncharacterized protein n=1 Tax=Aspergillus caelatus TaxID=61420 RepID=A0A5N6ZIQ8_9EURO|nr:uncharacterized protein BDV27DRAFT_164672 [Aspergillus caelatus]KAE8357268.1 hypothetical protein BDV27DRAFT_164672 [Aspergillus caelatus]